MIKDIETRLAMRPWATSLCLGFLICKIRIITVPICISCILPEVDTEQGHACRRFTSLLWKYKGEEVELGRESLRPWWKSDKGLANPKGSSGTKIFNKRKCFCPMSHIGQKWSGSRSPQRSVTGWGYPGKACPKGAATGGCHLTSLLADKVSSLLNRGLNDTPPCWPHYLMGLWASIS